MKEEGGEAPVREHLPPGCPCSASRTSLLLLTLDLVWVVGLVPFKGERDVAYEDLLDRRNHLREEPGSNEAAAGTYFDGTIPVVVREPALATLTATMPTVSMTIARRTKT